MNPTAEQIAYIAAKNGKTTAEVSAMFAEAESDCSKKDQIIAILLVALALCASQPSPTPNN